MTAKNNVQNTALDWGHTMQHQSAPLRNMAERGFGLLARGQSHQRQE